MTMATWEYRIIDSRDVAREGLFSGRSRRKLEEHLNKLGQQGWEIINLDFNDLQSNSEYFLGVAKRMTDARSS